MLHGETEAIRIEPPGVKKVEFVVTVGSRQELHQAKRSHPNGKWSLATLGADGLLQAIGEQLAGNDDRFVFVSGSDARELSELCEAASHAESTEEFERDFLAARERKKLFEKLLDYWKCNLTTAVERLRRIKVRTIGERDLEEKLRLGVRSLFLANPEKVLTELQTIVEDSVHRTWTRQALVGELDRRGYSVRQLRSPEHAGVAVEAATNRYIDGARSRLIRKKLVRRSAAETLLSRLEGTATDSVVTGRAGSGKTACVVEVVEGLRERGLPVLAFRLDRVPSASTTADLGRYLNLEESPVLVLAAAAEATGRSGILIVDQLDAVSTMSGRSSEAFDLVERLLHEARGTRSRATATIHTVVVCRTFDWKNDSRLRQLMPDSHAQVDVAEFPVDEVKTILAETGFDPALFRERQLEVLRLPQNLSLFIEAGFDTSLTPAFSTATELFGRYWDEKRRSVAERVSASPDQWMEVVKTLCDEMTSSQQLSVPKERLDPIQPDYLYSMASEGVLAFDGYRYGFGHESFFDYCFARVFFNQSESLVSFLKKSEQHLFRRAQVRQVLAYLRDADPDRYTQELGGLLAAEGIRAHIKALAFALLAEVTDPTEEEWDIQEKWIAPELNSIEQGTPNRDKLSEIAWRRFFTAPSWFAVADQRGVIKDWLASDNDRLVNVAVKYLNFHQRHAPDRVAALLEPYADCGGEWALRLRSLMEWADHQTSRRFFDLFLHLVDNGTLDEARGPSTFWSMLYGLGERRPEWVPEVVAHRLRRCLAVIRHAGGDLNGRQLLGSNGSLVKMCFESSARAPADFVEHVLPVVLEISELAARGDNPPKFDVVWQIPMQDSPPAPPSGKDACLSGLAEALVALAREDTADLRDVITNLRRRDTHIANHLLLALYGGGTTRYADEAVSLLCDEPWRFKCGFVDSPNWCAMEAIRAVIPHCTIENRERLEHVILDYVSPYERTRDGYRENGRTRFALLSAIPVELRSTRANTHFKELERKFGEPQGEPRGIAGGLVRSPIEESATDKMTDDQWLRAIAKYHSEDQWDFSDDEVKGGALELARALEARAKEEPERFAHLSLRFPADANPVYLERTLSALKSASVESDLKLQVCRKAFSESHEACGQSIADVLGGIEEPLSDIAVEMLHWLATEHEDPAREAWQEDAGDGRKCYNGDIHVNGINTTRGRAAEAIRDIIITDDAYIDRFRPTLDRMIRDSSAAVLSCVAGTLRAVAHRDPVLGMSLFHRMNLSEDRLLATRHVYKFILGGLRDNFAELRLTVERMIRSPKLEVCEAGARLASIATLLEHDSAADLADEALRGSVHHRLGVAQIASANLAIPEYRAWSEAKLITLFNDDDADVRSEAASCFRHLGDEPLDTYEDLITVFCDSKAYQENSFSILHLLEESLGRLPGMTCVVCKRFLDRFADEARDVRTSRSADTYAVAKLIFRTYQQHQNDEWTSPSLDLIDRLCLEEIAGAGDEFEQFER
ncbi:MAG: hypothetical protein F4X75_07965 [Gemmatimonadetes bacterium]|nr:hypothetical protein [Gemmatimonadota bacterium]